MAYEFPVAVKS